MEDDRKIRFIGYKRLSDMARAILSRPEFAEILLVDSDVDQLHNVIDEATAGGCEVFVAGSGNAAEFRRYSGAPLIELKVRLIDYFLAVRKALQLGKSPVVVLYRYSESIRSEDLSRLFDTPIKCITYQSSEELLKKLRESGGDVVVGAAKAAEAAEELGRPCVFVYPGQETIVEALHRARTLLKVLHRERRNAKLVNTIVSESATGIIGLSERREVLLVNDAARRLTGLTSEQVRRTGLEQLISDAEFQELLSGDRKSVSLMRKVAGQPLRLQMTKLEDEGRNLGVLVLLERQTAAAESLPPETMPASIGLATFHDVVRRSSAMRRTVAQAKKLGATAEMPLTIAGEYGVGKELLAQNIYSAFHADKGDYVTLNCATISPEAVMGLLSPCEKNEEDGAPDLSHVGVLVLENIWEADGKLQAALLGIADGRTNSLAVNQGKGLPRFKIITLLPDSRHSLFTTNVRPDLCYLLQTLVLSVPPLRERREDLMGLFSLCLKSDSGQSRTDYGLEVGLSPIITGYSFPGNMYEMRSVCRRYAMELSTGRLTLVGKKRLLIDCIGQEVLLDEVIFKAAGGRDLESLDSAELTGLVESMKEVLLYSNEQVAKKLGMSRTSLWRRLQQK